MKFAKKQQLYKISLPKGTLSDKSMPDVLQMLSEAAFAPIDDDPSMSEGGGFVSVLDDDRSVDDDGISFGELWLAGYRKDVRKADKKAAQALLKREIRKGAIYDKKGKKERLEEIMDGLREKAVPIPASQIVVFDPQKDRVFTVCANRKKAEEFYDEVVASALGIDTSGVEFGEEGEEEEIKAFLEDLWIRSENGQGPDFVPASVAGEECVTTSKDSADLAFGRVNGKKCASGALTLDNGCVADLKADTLYAMKISPNLENAPSDGAELLEFTARVLVDAFDEVQGRYEDFKKAGKEADASMFEKQARKVLG